MAISLHTKSLINSIKIMKKSIVLFLCLAFVVNAFAQNEHMNFVEGDWQTLLDKAKKEKKPFFVDFYTEWCGWCKVMEKKTFNNKDVISYVDKHYLAYQIDAEKGEGIALRRKYNINSYPTILIFDKDGKMIMRVLGYQDVQSFLDILEENKGKDAPESSVQAAVPTLSSKARYFEAKETYFKELEELISATKNDQIAGLEQKALQYGKENNHFDYSELQFAAEKDFNISLKNRLEMYYHLGREDNERMAAAAKAGLAQNEFEEQEAHYVLLLLLKNGIADLEMLQAINELSLKSKDYDLLDTKAAIQLFVGDKEDAYATAKKAKKIGEKADEDIKSTEVLIEMIE